MREITNIAVQAGLETNEAVTELNKAARKMQRFANQINAGAEATVVGEPR